MQLMRLRLIFYAQQRRKLLTGNLVDVSVKTVEDHRAQGREVKKVQFGVSVKV